MTCLTRADFLAARSTDDELVALVRSRLVAAGSCGAVHRLDALTDTERSVLARLERCATAPLPDYAKDAA